MIGVERKGLRESKARVDVEYICANQLAMIVIPL